MLHHLASLQMLADNDAAPAGVVAFIWLMACGGLVIGLAIQALICFLIIKLFKRVPVEHQKQNPNMVWLLMVPCLNLVWVWFVYPKLSQSYESWGKATGNASIGNASGGVAMALCICVDCAIIPFLNYLAGPVALILLIVYLVQINGLQSKLALPGAPSNPV